MNALVYWIWLSLACTPGTTTFADLISKFSDAEEIYNATDRQLRSAINPKISDCSALYDKDLTRAQEIYEFCTTKSVGIVTYSDEDYPKLLKRIPDPPVLLYYRGRLPDWNSGFRCAMVGTRNLTSYGRRVAFTLGYDLATVGGIVVSGMARGIDGVALAGALCVGGVTVAVLGSGIDVCYPKEHLTLARQIVKQGCIFTEYAPGTPPLKHNFPTRNRLISGLCEATVVIECGTESGALITGRRAMKQNRQVYAVPAAVDDAKSSGTNMLIKEGARICMDITELIEDYVSVGMPKIFDIDKLERKPSKNYMDVLREYRVVANTPDDDIFVPSGRFSNKSAESELRKPQKRVDDIHAKAEMPGEPPAPPKKRNDARFNKVPPIFGFTSEQLVLYKKIPPEGDCSIESLVDEDFDIKTVMKILLKLEMGRFIIILPGDRVRRNLK